MKIVEGRNFSYDISSDTAGKSVIINQTMAKQLNLTNPIGKRISNGGIFTIVGVVQDFNFESMRGDIQPVALQDAWAALAAAAPRPHCKSSENHHT